MLATLDYNSAITHQYHDLERGKRSFDLHFSLGFIMSVFVPRLIKKLNGILISHLLSTKGALAQIKEIDQEFLNNRDLSVPIDKVTSLLELNISFLSDIEKIIDMDEEKRFPGLIISQSVLTEIIENIYSILRTLKKANRKIQHETSELAKGLSRISVNSLERVHYGN